MRYVEFCVGGAMRYVEVCWWCHALCGNLCWWSVPGDILRDVAVCTRWYHACCGSLGAGVVASDVTAHRVARGRLGMLSVAAAACSRPQQLAVDTRALHNATAAAARH